MTVSVANKGKLTISVSVLVRRILKWPSASVKVPMSVCSHCTAAMATGVVSPTDTSMTIPRSSCPLRDRVVSRIRSVKSRRRITTVDGVFCYLESCILTSFSTFI